MSHEYAFDVKLNGAIRIKALDEGKARALLDIYLDAALANFGCEDDGSPIVGEVSLATEPSEARLFEVDGEDAPPVPVRPTADELCSLIAGFKTSEECGDDANDGEDAIAVLDQLIAKARAVQHGN